VGFAYRIPRKVKERAKEKRNPYTSRTKAIKKLGLSPFKFRRLMIWKGLHPVLYNNKKTPKQKIFYYKKDISHLHWDPILKHFKVEKIHGKRVKSSRGRGDFAELRKKVRNTPVLKLDHLVKERYPSFEEALYGLDDALNLLAVYTKMNINRENHQISQEMINEAQALYRDFLAYVVHSRSLRKVFVTIKGIFYEVVINGVNIHWVTPFQAYVAAPVSKDLSILDDFLAFYVCFMKFMNYRLYMEQGLLYPPEVLHLDNLDVDTLSQVNVQRKAPEVLDVKDKEGKKKSKKRKNKKGEEKKGKKQKVDMAENAKLGKDLKAKLDKKFADLLKKGIKLEPEEVVVKKEIELDDDDVFMEEEVKKNTEKGKKEDETTLKKEKNKRYRNVTKLFEGLRFYLNRETFLHSLDFVIRSCGGDVSWDGKPYSEGDVSITHQVVDKDIDNSTMVPGREYVQPQWVYDSINSGILLPVHEYSSEVKELPPHLSPWVNDRRIGYVPERRENLNSYIEREKNRWKDGKPVQEEQPDIVDSDDEILEEENITLEEKFSKDLANEQSGKKYSEELEDYRQRREQAKIDGGLDQFLAKQKGKKEPPKAWEKKKVSREEDQKKHENQATMSKEDSEKMKGLMMGGSARRSYLRTLKWRKKKENVVDRLLKKRKHVELWKEKRDMKDEEKGRKKDRKAAMAFVNRIQGKK